MTTLGELREQTEVLSLLYDFRNNTLVNPKVQITTRDLLVKPIKRIVFHCTDSEGWSPERLSTFFVDERGFSICAYHYYVTKDKIYHMVGESVFTPHAAPFNSDSVAFSIDYFASRDERLRIIPQKELMKNAIRTAAYLCLKHKVLPVKGALVGHRELPGTGFFKGQNDIPILRKTCPGLTIDLDIFRYAVAKLCQQALGIVSDGIVGPKTKEAFAQLPKF